MTWQTPMCGHAHFYLMYSFSCIVCRSDDQLTDGMLCSSYIVCTFPVTVVTMLFAPAESNGFVSAHRRSVYLQPRLPQAVWGDALRTAGLPCLPTRMLEMRGCWAISSNDQVSHQLMTMSMGSRTTTCMEQGIL